MIRISLLALALALPTLGGAAAQETKSYRLEIGSSSIEIDPGEVAQITLPDGSTAQVKLTRNEFARFATDRFSFTHPSGVSVTESKVADGITQFLMATALGTLVIVQEYEDIDPTSLKELMLSEITKEAVQAGAKLKKSPTSREIGKTLTGLKATQTGNDEIWDYEVLTYSADGDSGVLIVTGINSDNREADEIVVSKFWETLQLK